MEPHTQTDDTAQSRRVFESQLRECYGRVVYSHKTHEKCADILLSRFSRIKLAQILLSALTTAGCLAALTGLGATGTAVALVLSTMLLVLNAYAKNYDLGQLAQKHREAAADLWFVREKYLSLITDLAMGEKPLEKLQLDRDELLKKLHGIYSGAPSTTFEAYRKAQEALKQLEDLTFADEEIDAFLPKALRRSVPPAGPTRVAATTPESASPDRR
ncbi:MAG: SLATT domain-containing protein [Burkholderiales bacterium]|nr:SLATT domain-containing protein [Betaproteobacteria bacterium]MDX2218243.1 SLATT domain-containing protein [Burkholderiales bacterium]